MSTQFKNRAHAVSAFALALCLSSCSGTHQTDSTQTQTTAQSSPTPADQQGARRGAGSRWWIRVRGDGRTVAFTEDGVLKKELPRMPRMSEYSPDGSRLLEVRFTNGASDIFIADADGSHARRVVPGVSVEDEAHWSHDGAHILYAASGGEGGWVFEADERGAVLRKSAHVDGVVAEPLYTPDGRVSYILRHIPTEQRQPHSNNFVIKKYLPSDVVVTDGTTERVVVEGRLLRTYAWDSSGQRLAFSTYDDGLIVTRDLAGGTERVVKLSDIDKRLGGFAAHNIRWRPDGGAIAFTLSFTGGRWQGDKEVLFGERQLFVLYPDGHATWFDVEKEFSIFDWIPANSRPE
jgi:hypothetical protein